MHFVHDFGLIFKNFCFQTQLSLLLKHKFNVYAMAKDMMKTKGTSEKLVLLRF